MNTAYKKLSETEYTLVHGPLLSGKTLIKKLEESETSLECCGGE